MNRRDKLSLDQPRLERLIVAKESARVEFKEKLNKASSTSIREAVCAFANDLSGTGEPGIVVVGLKDDGTLAGTAVTDQILRALADIKTDGAITPPPTLLVEKRSYLGQDIAVVTVQPSDAPPVRYRGRIHVRSGPRKDTATAQDERVLNERRRHANRPFDAYPLPSAGIADLNTRQFEEEYLPHLVDREILLANDRTSSERLAAAKMISSATDEIATILGLLVVGARPRDFVPGAYVQFLRIAGNSLSDPIADELTIDGSISDMLVRVDAKLKAHNQRRIDLVSADREILEQTFPLAAIQQLVRNAIMHRDYETSNAPVRVTWFDDRIEILNPGGPYGAVTIENFGQSGLTDYRNPNLAEAMKVLGYVQKFGFGIPSAKRLLAEAGHPDIEFDVTPTHVLATVKTAIEHDQGAK